MTYLDIARDAVLILIGVGLVLGAALIFLIGYAVAGSHWGRDVSD